MVDFHVEVGASKVFVSSPADLDKEDEGLVEEEPVWTEEEKNLVDQFFNKKPEPISDLKSSQSSKSKQLKPKIKQSEEKKSRSP